MKALKRKSLLVLAGTAAMTLVACGKTASSETPVTYERGDDAEIYKKVFGDFATAYDGVGDDS
jgi:hypothetical protein